MDAKQGRALFNKYVNNECSPEERELLEKYLDSFQDDSLELSDLNFDEEIKPKMWSKIMSETTKEKQPVVRVLSFSSVMKYAAVIAGIAIGVSIWANLHNTSSQSLVIGDDKVVLRTSEGTSNEIVIGGISQINDDEGGVIASQEGDVIVYKPKSDVKQLVFNEIEVPRGKTFKVVLSDGTSVHLNSGTIFKFPVNFIQGEERKVFLTGEAYFEVAKDPEHPFLVNTSGMDVRVLGTHFNVSSYEGSVAHAVLIEGSVAVQEKDGGNIVGTEKVIVPGQKASLVSGKFEVQEVDVEDYVGWMRNVLIFNDEPFSEIVKKIERRYNVEIKNEYKELAPVRFNGKFDDETVIDLLETFRASAGFDYHISDNKVIINQNKRNSL
ncbi:MULTISPECIES: FecR family protein [unclassified Imperialibacter]|uniref:FecR family protein n=1 Tax=unclassified Imperialibacter TaxID=2629706 RepID=UPI0012568EDD|nr:MULTISPECIES: FecR domain-containing protein [unclassified Imperialibacter]CAD5279188.1 FecR family protein [Imperialibacter sp. 75]CAD5289045.1 FecR family protein [Imperialibacter sp. 89]VVT16401.1 FecR family protein [Imperialibacter sp. EC-SDR9]